ncbi:uncharacterized protein LOC119094462 [Pollicipes pollicipes]|uniref:uncharacterized protein LOC119094462 n=1 Tax=Pollicipes pollicipes TaxID=41117 RepID=UPI001884DA27|nr:uncharacterized protein LOC119094462 [Pollicipes pollicipes]
MLQILRPLSMKIRKRRTLKGIILVGASSLLVLVWLGPSKQDESEEERRPGGRPDLLLAAERRLSQLQLSSEEVFRALHGSLSAVTLRHGCSSVARVGGLCTCQVADG